MQIVGALDVHRRQITHKTLDLVTGDVRRGRLSPANRESVREWLECFRGYEAEFALEGTTGWRYVAEHRRWPPRSRRLTSRRPPKTTPWAGPRRATSSILTTSRGQTPHLAG